MAWIASVAYVGAALLLWVALRWGRDPRLAALLPRGAERRRGDRLLAAVGSLVRLRSARASVERRLKGADVERVMGAKVVLAALGLLLGAAASTAGPQALLAAAAMAAGGFVLPDFILARRAARDRQRAEARVPDLLDIVAVGASAGLTPRLALERAAALSDGALRAELERARAEVALGASWWIALRGAAARSGIAQLRRLAITLERSVRLGTPAAGPLRQLAREVRAEQRARAEERAGRAPVVMLFPLVFCILPAFVVAAVVPAVIVATRGIT